MSTIVVSRYDASAAPPAHLEGQGFFEEAQRVAALAPRVAARVRVDVHGAEVDGLNDTMYMPVST